MQVAGASVSEGVFTPFMVLTVFTRSHPVGTSVNPVNSVNTVSTMRGVNAMSTLTTGWGVKL